MLALMAQLFSGAALWRELQAEAKKSHRLDAAVAFVGKCPENVLTWPKETRLVTDVSEGRVRSGATSATGVTKLMKRGVEVRSLPWLHAKVYVFDSVAFIGSANASESSMSGLEEAAVKLTEASEVRKARELVREWSEDASPLSATLLKALCRLEPKRPGGVVPPRRSTANSVGRGPAFSRRDGVWLEAVVWVDLPPKVVRAQIEAAKKLSRDGSAEEEAVDWSVPSPTAQKKVPPNNWLFVWHKPTKARPFGRLWGPLRCLGEFDLGRGVGRDNRFQRAEDAERARYVDLDATGFRLMAAVMTRKVARTYDAALELHDEKSEADPMEVRSQEAVDWLVRHFPRR